MLTSFHLDVSVCREALNVFLQLHFGKDPMSSMTNGSKSQLLSAKFAKFRTRECHGTHAMRANIYKPAINLVPPCLKKAWR